MNRNKRPGSGGREKQQKGGKHWYQRVRDTLVSRTEDGSFNFTIKGGAENALFTFIGEAKTDKIVYRAGKLHSDDIILEVDGTKVAGFTLKDVQELIKDSKDPVSLKTVKPGQGLTKDLRQYLNTRFQKGSVDHDLQQTIRDNVYLRTVPCLKKVGFQDENQGDHFYEVRSITEAHGDPKAVVLRFHSASQSGKTPPSKLVVNLDNFLAPPDTEWVVLEDAEDAATFIDTYIKIRQELRKVDEEEDVVGSDADLFEFKTNSPDNSGSGREKEDLEENMEEEERDGGALGQDALEDEGEGEPNPIRRRYMTYQRGKAKDSALEIGEDDDGDADWKDDGGDVDSDDDSGAEERPTEGGKKKKKSKAKKRDREDPKQEFEKTVGKMRSLHPEVNTVDDSKMLDKNAGGWRTAVAALLGTALHKVSSNMATYVTVATLSPRCYQEALDIMSKWSSGECRGQGKSLKVTQTIFKELNGMGKELEDDIYSLLHRLNHGEIEKEEFDTEAKAKKKNCASRSKSKPSKEVTDGEVQELKKEKEKTEGELRDLKKEKERTEEELSDLRKEKEKIEEDVRELKKEKEKTEQELSDLKKEKEKAEGKDDQKIVASLRAEIASVQAEKRELEKKVEDLLEENKKLKVLLESKLESTAEANLKRRPSEEEQPVSKRSKTVSNWEGKAIEPGQLVAVAFSAPRRFHIGKVLEVDIEKQYSVHVQFYKPARKILENYGEPEWTKPQFVLDTSVDVPKDGVTLLPVSKSEQGRLKEKAKQFWSVESK